MSLPPASIPRAHALDPQAGRVALFDSGVGGLTVLEALARRRPDASFVYVADQAHVPYGGRALGEIRRFAEALTAFGFASGAEVVVMACNVSSATYGELGRRRYGDRRVVGVVTPGAQAASMATRRGAIGILATEGTVRSEAYPRALARIDPSLAVTQVACPAFVPLVEAGELDGKNAQAAVSAALEPLRAAKVDTVVLGCTHFPYLLGLLERLAPGMRFVDPAEAAADEAVRSLSAARGFGPSTTELLTTGDPEHFERQLNHLLRAERRAHASVGGLRWAPPFHRPQSTMSTEAVADQRGFDASERGAGGHVRDECPR